ncbi:N-acetylneuraminate synthase [Candidatus Viridilinea mediisalina]|uniref:N-acetylneuraminate synthase n=1 Tax=Candidatus Viridilinea mediisalina TaxID=2024553 RepID=A0A2A6RME1_9CHLR|nr:N-acetylneuraminate synthase [Candidatus Viridilinea mediisalina]
MEVQIQLANRRIGAGQPCFIIAEAGVNHNGDVQLAKELIYKAKEAGADCVKFQTFKAERIITATAPKAAYQLQTTDPQESQMEMLRKLELAMKVYGELLALAKKLDIFFMSTPYSVEDVDFLTDIGVSAFKLASIQIVEPYLLRHAAQKGIPMIISTGMAYLSEIDTALRTVRRTGNEQIVLLQCTTNYPSRLEDTHLHAMVMMRDAFGTLVGYSDHTQSDIACIAAVALGACVVEKHFTLDKHLPGPDQSTSYDPQEFARLVRAIRDTELVLGRRIKEPTATEQANMMGMRRSIVAKRDLQLGEVLTAADLTFKRPANGLAPATLDAIVGRRLVRAVAADACIDFADLGEYDGG